jgi:hypothetical protein
VSELTPRQQLTNVLFQQIALYEQVLRDFSTHPLPDYMVVARAKETLARAAAMMREANSKG